MREDRRRLEFCCKTEVERGIWGPVCSRQDIVFVGHGYGPRRDMSLVVVLEMVLTVLTNGGFLVPALMLAKRGRISEFLCAMSLFLTSLLYHICDTFEIKILNMTAGNWHRLDNVFTIINSITLVSLLMGKTHHSEIVRWLGLLLGIFFQELHPWHLGAMLAPILITYCYYFAWMLFVADVDQGLRRLTRCFKPLFLLALALLAFYFGLFDQKKDLYFSKHPIIHILWARAAHGLWHLLNAMAAASFISILLDEQSNTPASISRHLDPSKHERKEAQNITRPEEKKSSINFRSQYHTSLRNRHACRDLR